MQKIQKLLVVLPLLAVLAFAEGTQTWRETSYDDFSKGTPKGVAIRSDGTLEVATSFKAISTLPSTYIWSIVSDSDGTMYIGTGAPARVYRITPDGKATVIFQPKELQVQALALDPKQKGLIYAATSPDGKVYRIERGAGGAKESDETAGDTKSGRGSANSNSQAVVSSQKSPATADLSAEAKQSLEHEKERPALSSVPVDSNYAASAIFDPKTKYIWALAVAPGNEGHLYVATGDRGEIFRVTFAPAAKKGSGKDKAAQ